MAFARAEKNFQLGLLHVNFGLRAEASDGDEAFISRLAATHGVPLFLKQVSEAERQSRRGESIQEWARRVRFEEFEKLAKDGWTIALAHHQDDVAENVLLRLARGASPGYLGMRAIELPYWRPLLHLKKAQLATFVAANQIEHRHDASNDKLEYSRNVIRHKVLPELEAMFPGAAARIAACAEEAADVSAHSRSELLTELLGMTPGAAQRRLAELPRGLARAGLAGLTAAKAPGFRQLSRHWLDAVLDQAASGSLARYGRDIPGGGRVLIDGKGLIVEPSHVEPSHTVIMSSPSV